MMNYTVTLEEHLATATRLYEDDWFMEGWDNAFNPNAEPRSEFPDEVAQRAYQRGWDAALRQAAEEARQAAEIAEREENGL